MMSSNNRMISPPLMLTMRAMITCILYPFILIIICKIKNVIKKPGAIAPGFFVPTWAYIILLGYNHYTNKKELFNLWLSRFAANHSVGLLYAPEGRATRFATNWSAGVLLKPDRLDGR